MRTHCCETQPMAHSNKDLHVFCALTAVDHVGAEAARLLPSTSPFSLKLVADVRAGRRGSADDVATSVNDGPIDWRGKLTSDCLYSALPSDLSSERSVRERAGAFVRLFETLCSDAVLSISSFILSSLLWLPNPSGRIGNSFWTES
jgi:hypothetical protein